MDGHSSFEFLVMLVREWQYVGACGCGAFSLVCCVHVLPLPFSQESLRARSCRAVSGTKAWWYEWTWSQVFFPDILVRLVNNSTTMYICAWVLL